MRFKCVIACKIACLLRIGRLSKTTYTAKKLILYLSFSNSIFSKCVTVTQVTQIYVKFEGFFYQFFVPKAAKAQKGYLLVLTKLLNTKLRCIFAACWCVFCWSETVKINILCLSSIIVEPYCCHDYNKLETQSYICKGPQLKYLKQTLSCSFNTSFISCMIS